MTKKQTETRRTFLSKAACASVMIVFAGPGVLNAADLGQTRGTHWTTCLKWSVTNPSWTGSPFDVVATVVFTHQSTGDTRITEMYYDEAATWTFRFTGTKQGVWTFVSASCDPDLDGHTGKVIIDPNPDVNAHGFLKNLAGKWVTADQLKAWRDGMHRHMGWHHFLGGRPAGPNQGADHTRDATWNQGLDYSSYEHHRPTYEVYVAALRAVPGQPVMSEDRFRIRRSPYPEKDYSEDRTRRGLYHSAMAGGVANIWGIDPVVSPGGVFPNKEQLKTYAVFFVTKNRFLADIQPANQLSGDAETRVLRSPSAESLVLYREDTRTIQVDLAGLPGPQPAMAVDTKKPYAEIHLGNLQPRDQMITLPVVSDWVVAIGHFKADPQAPTVPQVPRTRSFAPINDRLLRW